MLYPNTVYNLLQTHFMSPGFTLYETGTSLDWDGDAVLYFFILHKRTLCCYVPSHVAATPALNLSRFKVGVPYIDFKHTFHLAR